VLGELSTSCLVFLCCNLVVVRFFTAWQVLYLLRQIRPSVCPSFRHTPVLCQNEGTQRDAVFTVGQPSDPSFLMPRRLMGDDPIQVKFDCKEVDPPV